MKNTDYDLIIVGGGMVGAALACAVVGLRVGIIEKFPAKEVDLDAIADLRVSAITHASRHILERCGAWNGIIERRFNPFEAMRVWDATGDGQIAFHATESSVDYLGYIVENRVIQSALWDQINKLDRIDLLCPNSATSTQIEADAVYVTLETGQTITSKLLVGADGRDSKVRSAAGIASRGWDYDHTALVATVKPEYYHQATAWQRFLPTGPLAFLPLSDDTCSIVWSTSHEHAEELLAIDENSFAELLAEAFEYQLGMIEQVGPRAGFPLRLRHTMEYVRHRLALIGDAAHAIHPLAGQGVNLGLLDAATLAEVVVEAARQRRDIGRMEVLRRHERWRKGSNITMMAAMDGFKRLFGSQLEPVRWARNFGMNLTNQLSPVKYHIMNRAMGMTGDLPKMARGASI